MFDKIKIPPTLPKSKYTAYILSINKGYDKICTLLYSLGCVCTYEQFRNLYKRLNTDISDTYLLKKAHKIIVEMVDLKLIETSNINNYKIISLKKFAFIFITGDYLKYPKKNMKVLLKDKNLKISLLKVEYYLLHNEKLNLSTLDEQLIYITKLILAATIKDPNLPYDKKLLNTIISDKGISNSYESIFNLSKNNLIRILWIDIYNIYKGLRLQNNTISSSPFILNLYKKDSLLTISYAPTIIIFDVFDIKYYLKKIDELFIKYFNIVTNHTRNMRKSFQENGNLGWEGYNHFAYTLKIIGFNEYELIQKKKTIDKFINDNPNGILLSSCTIEFIDISKYFIHSSRKNETILKIDSEFDRLIADKLK